MASPGSRVAKIEEMERVKGGSDSCGGIGGSRVVAMQPWWPCYLLTRSGAGARTVLVVKYGCLRREEGGTGGAKNPPHSQESSLWPEEWLQWQPHAFFTIPPEVSTNTSRGIQH